MNIKEISENIFGRVAALGYCYLFKGHPGIHEVAYNQQLVYNPLRFPRLTTISDIYGKPLSELKPPDGWEFTGEFRYPVPGEAFRDSQADQHVCAPSNWNEPRLILRKVKPKSELRTRIIFEPTGELRRAITGEWYGQGEGIYQLQGAKSEMTHPIYTRREECYLPEESA